MRQITGYLMSPVRGSSGDEANIEEMDANIAVALEVADWLRRHFPEVDWTIPHEHETIVRQLTIMGYIVPQNIVCAWSEIAKQKDIGVTFCKLGISRGMSKESIAMIDAGKVVVCIDETNEEAQEEISAVIFDTIEEIKAAWPVEKRE